MSQLFEELKRRKVFRVAAAYLVVAWVLLQVADLLVPVLTLPAWSTRLVFFLLAIGFFPALILAWAFELSPDGVRLDTDSDDSVPRPPPKRVTTKLVVAAIPLLVLIVGGGYWYFTADERWARNEAFPQIEAYTDARRWEDAYALAREAELRLPQSAELAELWTTIGFVTTIESTPGGARVFRRPYEQPDASWESMGTTPISDTRIPFGLSVIRLELEGRPPVERVIGGETAGRLRLPVRESPMTNSAAIPPDVFAFDTAESLPEGMVRVPGHQVRIGEDEVSLEDFYIGRYEVTNEEFKAFVDAGGYSNPQYWEHPFIRNGQEIVRADAMAEFVDGSGRPGPQFWIGGNYPEGQDSYPVTGISWYEAAAYAKFMGRELPSVHHWKRAHASGMIEWQLQNSNLETGGIKPVGESPGLGWSGTFDMLGNAREWCFNEVRDQRVIIGGSFDEPAYYAQQSINDPGAASPFNRNGDNGFRLAESRDSNAIAARLREPINPIDPPEIEEPVSDDVFEAYLSNFEYERRPLDPVIEESLESRHWTRHRISFSSHREGQRLVVYLFLPNAPATSYQAIVYWPTINALVTDSIDQQFVHLDFAMRNGRAVVLPVLDGTMERRRPSFPDWASIGGRDLVIEAIRDMRRSIDYLESRADINDDSIAFYGYSWGGRLGAMALAVESTRFKAGILNQAGLQHLVIPETSVLNYLPRVTAPVLQFNGRYDTDFRFESSAKPYFDLLGTPADRKRHVVSETSHYVPRQVVIGETLDWLDRYLGPVDR